MDQRAKAAIFEALKKEPVARAIQMELMKLEDGYSVVHKIYEPENMANIYAWAHDGAIYALIDEAFETAGQAVNIIDTVRNTGIDVPVFFNALNISRIFSRCAAASFSSTASRIRRSGFR